MGEESPSPPLGAAARCEQASGSNARATTGSGRRAHVDLRMIPGIAQFPGEEKWAELRRQQARPRRSPSPGPQGFRQYDWFGIPSTLVAVRARSGLP